MNCREFKNNLMGMNTKSGTLPSEFNIHLESCKECAVEYNEAVKYFEVLEEIRAPRQNDAFWNSYLTDVVTRTENRSVTAAYGIFSLKNISFASAFLAVVLIVLSIYSPGNNLETNLDDAYVSTMDFIYEEHFNVAEEYMLDASDYFTVEEIILVQKK